MNKYGAVLDDLGMEPMLDKIMNDYISPLARGDIVIFMGFPL